MRAYEHAHEMNNRKFLCLHRVIEAQPVWIRAANTHHVYLRKHVFIMFYVAFFIFFFSSSLFFILFHSQFYLGVDLGYHLCSFTVLWATDEELNADEHAQAHPLLDGPKTIT